MANYPSWLWNMIYKNNDRPSVSRSQRIENLTGIDCDVGEADSGNDPQPLSKQE